MRIMWSHRDPLPRKTGLANLFVKNLSPSINSASLEKIFSKFGNILSPNYLFIYYYYFIIIIFFIILFYFILSLSFFKFSILKFNSLIFQFHLAFNFKFTISQFQNSKCYKFQNSNIPFSDFKLLNPKRQIYKIQVFNFKYLISKSQFKILKLQIHFKFLIFNISNY